MTGLTLLRQAYGLLDREADAANADGDEKGLTAVNQIYAQLWSREHTTQFRELRNCRQDIALSWRCLPAMAYGTAMLLCINDADKTKYNEFKKLFERSSTMAGGKKRVRGGGVVHYFYGTAKIPEEDEIIYVVHTPEKYY